ncbi:hypothetical protein AB0E74_28570 [Streptomyces sp. NPDC030392]|uniref:hypothetical protein n=1 Tax=Streptomyces sp. NPDC030392 TaxID=3155468 RepID=UPI00341148D6
MSEKLIREAAANNAAWCEEMCRTHGVPGVFTGGFWAAPRHTVPYYPHLVTVEPAVSKSAATAFLRADSGGRGGGFAVKDSFADLDLSDDGFSVLFEAEWIHRPGRAPAPEAPPTQAWRRLTTPAELAVWERTWPGPEDTATMFPESLLATPVLFLGGFSEGRLTAGAVANASGGVMGLSNVFGPAGETSATWAGALSCLAREAPGVDVVGYERGDALAAALEHGCTRLGKLRVWLQDGTGE